MRSSRTKFVEQVLLPPIKVSEQTLPWVTTCTAQRWKCPSDNRSFEFMDSVFGVANGGTAFVSRGYGSTECGTIAMCGKSRSKSVSVEDKDKGIELDGEDGCPEGNSCAHNRLSSAQWGQRRDWSHSRRYSYFRPGCVKRRGRYFERRVERMLRCTLGDNLSGRRGVARTGADWKLWSTRTLLNNGEFVSPKHRKDSPWCCSGYC